MNETHREIAQLILRRLMAYLEGDAEALDEMVDTLQSHGVEAETIRETIELLLGQTMTRIEELVPAQPGGDPRRRVLSPQEREALTAEAYGYLLGLTADGRLGAEQLEAILARLGDNEIPADVDQIQELAWQVALDGVEGEEDNGPIRFHH